MTIRNYSPSSVNDLATYIEGLPWPEYPRGSLRWFGQLAYERGRLDLIRWCLRRRDSLSASDARWLCEVETDPAPFERRDARRLAGIFQGLAWGRHFPTLTPLDFAGGRRWSDAQTQAFQNLEGARLLAELAATLGKTPEALWDDIGCVTDFWLLVATREVYVRFYPAGRLPEGATRLKFVPRLRIDSPLARFAAQGSAEPPPAPPSLPAVPPPPAACVFDPVAPWRRGGSA